MFCKHVFLHWLFCARALSITESKPLVRLNLPFTEAGTDAGWAALPNSMFLLKLNSAPSETGVFVLAGGVWPS